MAENNLAQSMAASDASGGRATRTAPFGQSLLALAGARPDVVGLTADLGKYTDILPFASQFPSRYFNVGMAEQNLIAVAAGLAKTGYVPYCTTYAVFATRRAHDFISIACAHARLKVRIFAGLPGLSTSYGATHTAPDDLALMRAVPGLTIIDPADATELALVTQAVVDVDGPVYVRLLRGEVPVVFGPEHRFEIGRARLLRDGSDLGLISTGMMTGRALDAAARLASLGVSVAVLHVPTLKPFDEQSVLDLANRVDRLVSIENHFRSGGLGTAVAETLIDQSMPKPLLRLGLPDRHIECGSVATLHDRYGLSVDRLTERLRAYLRL
jgi:transketolase